MNKNQSDPSIPQFDPNSNTVPSSPNLIQPSIEELLQQVNLLQGQIQTMRTVPSNPDSPSETLQSNESTAADESNQPNTKDAGSNLENLSNELNRTADSIDLQRDQADNETRSSQSGNHGVQVDAANVTADDLSKLENAPQSSESERLDMNALRAEILEKTINQKTADETSGELPNSSPTTIPDSELGNRNNETVQPTNEKSNQHTESGISNSQPSDSNTLNVAPNISDPAWIAEQRRIEELAASFVAQHDVGGDPHHEFAQQDDMSSQHVVESIYREELSAKIANESKKSEDELTDVERYQKLATEARQNEGEALLKAFSRSKSRNTEKPDDSEEDDSLLGMIDAHEAHQIQTESESKIVASEHAVVPPTPDSIQIVSVVPPNKVEPVQEAAVNKEPPVTSDGPDPSQHQTPNSAESPNNTIPEIETPEFSTQKATTPEIVNSELETLETKSTDTPTPEIDHELELRVVNRNRKKGKEKTVVQFETAGNDADAVIEHTSVDLPDTADVQPSVTPNELQAASESQINPLASATHEEIPQPEELSNSTETVNENSIEDPKPSADDDASGEMDMEDMFARARKLLGQSEPSESNTEEPAVDSSLDMREEEFSGATTSVEQVGDNLDQIQDLAKSAAEDAEPACVKNPVELNFNEQTPDEQQTETSEATIPVEQLVDNLDQTQDLTESTTVEDEPACVKNPVELNFGEQTPDEQQTETNEATLPVEQLVDNLDQTQDLTESTTIEDEPACVKNPVELNFNEQTPDEQQTETSEATIPVEQLVDNRDQTQDLTESTTVEDEPACVKNPVELNFNEQTPDEQQTETSEATIPVEQLVDNLDQTQDLTESTTVEDEPACVKNPAELNVDEQESGPAEMDQQSELDDGLGDISETHDTVPQDEVPPCKSNSYSFVMKGGKLTPDDPSQIDDSELDSQIQDGKIESTADPACEKIEIENELRSGIAELLNSNAAEELEAANRRQSDSQQPGTDKSQKSESVADVLARMQAEGKLESDYSTIESDVDIESSPHVEVQPSDSMENLMPVDEIAPPVSEPIEEGIRGDDDTSVKDYMSQLFERLNVNPGETVEEAPVIAPTPTEPKPNVVEANLEPISPMDASEYKPKAMAPEKTTSLDALRQVALQSSRSAIATSNKKRKRESAFNYLAIAVAAIILAGFFYALGSQIISMFTFVAIAFLSGAGFAAWKFVQFQKVSDQKQNKNKSDETSDEEVEATDN